MHINIITILSCLHVIAKSSLSNNPLCFFAGHDEFIEESVQQTGFEREVHYFISDLVCIECDLKGCTFKSTAHFIIDIMANDSMSEKRTQE